MFVGFGYAARQQARNAAIDAEDAEEPTDGASSTAGGREPAVAPAARKRKHATAEEEEDAILDAQGY